ncbi:hypothetical protein SD960_19425 [Flavobacterium sp. MMLR14_040]|uniref:hypothetical protein n=1 Tax=Flavobacterium sp. MMLR14_040 TaxID=3093843 RepID=UPI00298FDA41|nr:hypothetical protein [Flavobacterium sp. MMLR14_040]MDW8852285.1 hypothetical protein [Flavobacterium sp. MMLR14_040]
MKRIYLDSNVFRYLKQNPDLLEMTFDVINNFIFYYSYAHLADLSRDKTDKKFEDLIFMENLVDNNFLNLQPDKKYVNVQLVSPTLAFKSLTNFNFSNINFTDIIDNVFPQDNSTPEIDKAKELLKMLLTFPIKSLGIEDLNFQTEGTIVDIISPNGTNSILEYLEKLVNTFEDLNSDVKLWRELRNYTIENLNFSNFEIDIQNIEFDKQLENTELKSTFIEFVENALGNFTKTENRDQYNFFITAYTCLNLLGIDKEKSKKVVFSSFQNDAQHAYYAAHCEYLISDDEQLLFKAKALYNLLGIKTQVLHANEFFNNLDKIGSDGELEFNDLIGKLNDLKNNIDFSNSTSFNEVMIFRLYDSYFDYFNEMQIIEVQNENDIFAFYKEYENYSNFSSFEEMELITNRIVRTLGRDLYNLKKYSEKDTLQIKNDEWQGRVWDFDYSKFYLEINNKRFTLHYQLK